MSTEPDETKYQPSWEEELQRQIEVVQAENAALRAQVAGLEQQLLRARSSAALARTPTRAPSHYRN